MISKTNQNAEKRSPNGHRAPTLARIQEALDLAVQDAVALHREHGLPLAIWQDGKTAHVSADSINPTAKARKQTGK